MNKFICPRCKEVWDGEYTYEHRCVTCNAPLHVIDFDEDTGETDD